MNITELKFKMDVARRNTEVLLKSKKADNVCFKGTESMSEVDAYNYKQSHYADNANTMRDGKGVYYFVFELMDEVFSKIYDIIDDTQVIDFRRNNIMSIMKTIILALDLTDLHDLYYADCRRSGIHEEMWKTPTTTEEIDKWFKYDLVQDISHIA